jgi:hypothetical protein
VLSAGKVLLLHQQNELNETLSLNWKRNEQLPTSAVGEAIASKSGRNTNCGELTIRTPTEDKFPRITEDPGKIMA